MSWVEVKGKINSYIEKPLNEQLNSNPEVPLNELIGGNNVGNRVASYDSGKTSAASFDKNQTLLSISNSKGGFLRNLSVFFNSYYSSSSSASGNAMLTVQISVDGSLFKTYKITTNSAAGKVRYSMAINLSNNKDMKQSYMSATTYLGGSPSYSVKSVPYVNNFGKFYTSSNDNSIEDAIPELVGEFRCENNDAYDNSSCDIVLGSNTTSSNLNVLFENPIFFKESLTVSIKAYDAYAVSRSFRFAGKVNYNIL